MLYKHTGISSDICDVKSKEVPWLWFQGEKVKEATYKRDVKTECLDSLWQSPEGGLHMVSQAVIFTEALPHLCLLLFFTPLLSLVSFILVFSLGLFFPLLLFLPLWGPQFYLVQEVILNQLSINMRHCCPCSRKKNSLKAMVNWALSFGLECLQSS